jgi:hypothetical protein
MRGSSSWVCDPVDTDTLTTAALGVGILAAGVWNGWETYRTKRLTRALHKPVQETHRQVSVNRHVSNPPTLLDKVDRLEAGQHTMRLELLGAAGMFEGHMDASAEDRGELWRHVRALERLVGTPEPVTPDERSPDEPDLS